MMVCQCRHDVMVDSEGTLAFDISTTSEIEENKRSVPVLPSDTLYGTTSYYPIYEIRVTLSMLSKIDVHLP